jgi:hypothetical protein
VGVLPRDTPLESILCSFELILDVEPDSRGSICCSEILFELVRVGFMRDMVDLSQKYGRKSADFRKFPSKSWIRVYLQINSTPQY